MDLSNLIPASILNENIFSIENWFLIAMAIVWMIVSSIQDFRKREVENWWNFSLIIFALVYRAFLSVEKMNFMYIVWGIIGLAGGFVLANVFYYSRIFAGGDAKLLMALGVIIPLSLSWQTNLYLLALFLIFFILAGSVYGLVFSIFLTIKNYKRFTLEFPKQFKKYSKIIFVILCIVLLVIAFFIFIHFYMGILLGIILFISPFLLVYAKALEEGCMFKLVNVKDLTIGDWTVKSIRAGKEVIKPNWEGLSEQELILIKKYCKGKIEVKQGIPFVPSFLLAFLAMVVFLKFF